MTRATYLSWILFAVACGQGAQVDESSSGETGEPTGVDRDRAASPVVREPDAGVVTATTPSKRIVCTLGEKRTCYPAGAPEPDGGHVGTCRVGQQTCVDDGSAVDWGPCDGAVTPVKEICGDGFDNDCDGRVDNGCPVTVRTNSLTPNGLYIAAIADFAPGPDAVCRAAGHPSSTGRYTCLSRTCIDVQISENATQVRCSPQAMYLQGGSWKGTGLSPSRGGAWCPGSGYVPDVECIR